MYNEHIDYVRKNKWICIISAGFFYNIDIILHHYLWII